MTEQGTLLFLLPIIEDNTFSQALLRFSYFTQRTQEKFSKHVFLLILYYIS